MACITFKELITSWNHPAMNQLTYRDIFQALLPDLYNEALTPASLYSDCQQSLALMTPEILNKVLKGNKRSEKGGRYYVNATFTKTLQKILLSNQPIQYKKEFSNQGNKTPKESMLCNIKSFVATTQPAVNKNHSLFSMSLTKEYLYDSDLIQTIQQLLDSENQDCFSYAIFLLVLLSLFQDHIIEFKKYYAKSAIDAEFFNNHSHLETTPLYPYFTHLYKNDTLCIPFTDPMYMNSYNLYSYSTENVSDLYQCGSFVLELLENGIPHAKLQLKNHCGSQACDSYAYNFPHDSYTCDSHTHDSDTCNSYTHSSPRYNSHILNQPAEKTYTGTPMLSIINEMISIVFTNPDGLIAFLCFEYEHLYFSEMYFRTAFLIYPHTKQKAPSVQKVVISPKKFENNDSSTMKGLLKMSNDKIIITEQQLNHFLEEFSEAEWMNSFRKDFLPFIQTHKVPCYSFSENEILAYTLSELNESSRLEMLQALKTKSEAPHIITCKNPENLHELFHK